jgi:hypothetical protein
MALISPGVEVTVIDESFYTPAEPGTTPLIVIATAENKSNAAGTGTAAGTLAANIGRAFRITSQRELVETYGVPFFERTANGSPIHGGERNEYGLLSAYSMLGITNSIFVVRAGVDLGDLQGSTAAPGADPKDGAWWVDTLSTLWGIQEWNAADRLTVGGQKFANKLPIVLTSDDASKIDLLNNKPLTSVGSIGDYAVVVRTANDVDARMFYKSPGNGNIVPAGTWVLVGSADWKQSIPSVLGSIVVTESTSVTGPLLINGTTVEAGTASYTAETMAAEINGIGIQGISAVSVNGALYVYTDGTSVTNGSTTGNIEFDGEDWGVFGIEPTVYAGPGFQQSPHTQVPEWKSTDLDPRPSKSVWIKTTEPNAGARWRVKQWSGALQTWVDYSAPLYATGHAALYFLDRTGGGKNLPVDELYVQFNATEGSALDSTAEFGVFRRAASEETVIRSEVISAGTFTNLTVYSFTVKESIPGQQTLSDAIPVSYTANGTAGDAQGFAGAINSAGFTQIEADVTDENELLIYHKAGGDFRLTDGTATPLEQLFEPFNVVSASGTVNFYNAPAEANEDYIASNWAPLAVAGFAASANQPLDEPVDGQLWYNPSFGDVDIMIHNGTTWVGYRTELPQTDPNGPTVSASEPETQSDGITSLKNGDLWISTADLEDFPAIYRWNSDTQEWDLLDKTDQTTEDGVLFADARYGDAGLNVATPIRTLLTSDFLDPDAPDPDLYPKGMLLWNTRRSGGNVKRYANSYIDTAARNPRLNDDPMGSYDTDRWVTASPNNEDGSGSFGCKALRSVVVQAMKSVVDTSEEIRDEERRNFNIIAAPGYPELLSNLVNLNIDRGVTAFVIGDTPLRLKSNATALTNWASNENGAFDNGDTGLVTFDEYAAVYYPNGFTTDLSGANVVVPASHMMLRTIALSDQVSYPWFAPAGTRRGGITNATSVGYIDAATGEFQTVALNNGQRDTLYDLKVNPIPFFVGVGHVAYGQKTLARNASALDRINVARLVVYLRSQLNKLARPYIFEPNDKITRDEVKGAVESLLLELVGLRALYDFAVVCDESNNTPARIDRNELYVDIAIEPVKAVEFIYIPLRIQNTGEI